MKLNIEPVRNWFGYTRRERRSSSILLSIIVVIIFLRYLLPEKNIEIVQYDILPADTEKIQESSEKDFTARKGLFVSQKKENPSPVREKRHLDLNSCDSISLVALPGIGPVLSARIIKYRNLLGGFARVEQLKEVYGLPEETFGMIRERLFADTSLLRKTNINSSGFRELSHIPYLEKYEVTAILKYREITGRIQGMQELKENKILSLEKADKIEAYIDFR